MKRDLDDLSLRGAFRAEPERCHRALMDAACSVREERQTMKRFSCKTIVIAVLVALSMLTTAFAAASFLRSGSSVVLMNVLFALAGIGWATINVNSFPMVVEMCSGGDIGKYTGYYYTASMTAQILTPMLSGALMKMEGLGMTVLFPYAAVFAGLAFVTMFFVKHGDAKPEPKKGLEALDND